MEDGRREGEVQVGGEAGLGEEGEGAALQEMDELAAEEDDDGDEMRGEHLKVDRVFSDFFLKGEFAIPVPVDIKQKAAHTEKLVFIAYAKRFLGFDPITDTVTPLTIPAKPLQAAGVTAHLLWASNIASLAKKLMSNMLLWLNSDDKRAVWCRTQKRAGHVTKKRNITGKYTSTVKLLKRFPPSAYPPSHVTDNATPAPLQKALATTRINKRLAPPPCPTCVTCGTLSL